MEQLQTILSSLKEESPDTKRDLSPSEKVYSHKLTDLPQKKSNLNLSIHHQKWDMVDSRPHKKKINSLEDNLNEKIIQFK